LKALEGEAGKFRDIPTAEGFLECGQHWAEQGRMGKCNQVGRCGVPDGSVGGVLRSRRLQLKLPQFGCGGASASHDHEIIVADGDGRSREHHVAPRIAELANG
jgi:hypothetical protein